MEVYLIKKVILSFVKNMIKWIYLIKGYWKSSLLIKSFIKCLPYSDSCLETTDYGNKICDKGYIGTLCQTCNVNFAKFGASECSICPNKKTNFLLVLFIGIAILLFLSLYIK